MILQVPFCLNFEEEAIPPSHSLFPLNPGGDANTHHAALFDHLSPWKKENENFGLKKVPEMKKMSGC